MQPITAIADALVVADNTVCNGNDKLEDAGVIDGDTVIIYDRANVQHDFLFSCTARVQDRERPADAAREIPGAVEVLSVTTGTQNVHVKAAAPDESASTDIAHRLDGLGLAIEREHLIWSETHEPFTGFRLEENL